MNDLARTGRLVAPKEVLKELEQGGDDDIYQWAINNRDIFYDLDLDQIEVVKQIVNDSDLEGLVDIDKEIPEADPFVIALVVVRKRQKPLFPERWVVLADEQQADPGRKPRIPNACKKYNIECCNVLGMLDKEGWQF